MRKIFLFVFLFVLGGFTTAGTAEAQSACFDWFCYTHNGQCSFDASCSADSGATPIVFEWTWDDGSSTEYTFDEQISHTYAAPQAFANVTLNVGYLLVGYDDVTCRIQMRNVCCFPEPSFSGTCS